MIGSDSDVGRVLTQLRGERTQQAIADAMRERGWKWSQATVWSVEKGERPLKLREAAVLATVLGVTVETLVRDDAEFVVLSQKLASLNDEIKYLEQQIQEHRSTLGALQVRLGGALQEKQRLQAKLASDTLATTLADANWLGVPSASVKVAEAADSGNNANAVDLAEAMRLSRAWTERPQRGPKQVDSDDSGSPTKAAYTEDMR